MSAALVSVEPTGPGVWQVALDRPDKRNALDAALWTQLADVLQDLATNSDVACLVMTGTGSAFAAGGDIARFVEEVAEPGGPAAFRERIRRCLELLAGFPAPTVARVNGPAIGGGTEIALACDVRVASTSAVFSIPAARFAFVMAYPDFCRLAGAVGIDRARFLTMTGQRIDAMEAHRIGLVHAVADDLDGAVSRVTGDLVAVDRAAALWFRRAADAVASGAPSDRLRAFEEVCLRSDAFRSRVEAFLRKEP